MANDVKELLQAVANGEISVEKAELELKMKPFVELGYAKLDTHRKLRQGVAEVIYGAGKTAKQLTIPKAGTYSIMQNKFGKNMFSVDFETNAKELHEFLYN